MKRFMFLMSAMVYVVCISVSPAIGNDGPYLKWDVDGDGPDDTSVTLKIGETLVVELYATDIHEPGAAAFKMGDKRTNLLAQGMNYDDTVLTCNSVTVDSTVWPQTELNWTDITQSGEINCGGCGPLGVALLGNHRLISIEFTCDAAGSETFDFTETNEDFYLVKFGIGSLNVDEQTYALTITCDGGAPNLTYANSHNYTLSGQPPRYCPPGPPQAPTGVHPEYALGAPDEKGTGWGPETGELILGFPSPLKNIEGNDLTIWHIGEGTPKIWVSTQSENPDDWHEIGNLPASQEWRTDTFEFGNLDIIHYVKVEEWQSGQHTCHFIDAVAGVRDAAAAPQVDIKINGQDGPVTLHQSDTFSLAIGLDNNGHTDQADWWLAVNTPFGLYTFYSWVPYLETVYQGPLFYIPLTDPLGFPVSGLPLGTYTFYFVVDTVMDGQLSLSPGIFHFDYIEMNIEP